MSVSANLLASFNLVWAKSALSDQKLLALNICWFIFNGDWMILILCIFLIVNIFFLICTKNKWTWTVIKIFKRRPGCRLDTRWCQMKPKTLLLAPKSTLRPLYVSWTNFFRSASVHAVKTLRCRTLKSTFRHVNKWSHFKLHITSYLKKNRKHGKFGCLWNSPC